MAQKEKSMASLTPHYFLSICIPTWNRVDFLKENVEQILNELQKIPNFAIEVVISDNASTDETQKYCENLVSENSFVTYKRNANNIGANANFQQVIELASGEYTWLLGDDDKITEDCLYKIITDIKKYNNPDLVIGGCINDNTRKRLYPPFIEESLLTDYTFFEKYDVIRLAGKMSVLIFKKSSLIPIFQTALPIIQSLKTPWPHLIWVVLLMNQNSNLLFLPYCTNYFLEKNRFNMLQDGISRVNIMVREYATLIYALKDKKLLSQEFSTILISSISKGRQFEFIKIVGYSTYLNSYFSSLSNAFSILVSLSGFSTRLNFLIFYVMPLSLPIWLRKHLFNFVGSTFKNWDQFQTYLNYLRHTEKLFNKNKRNVFNKNGL